jgi:long-chain acyl-CoA synthetase
MAGAQIQRFLILHKELDPDDGELTRTRKVRRGFIAQKYGSLVEALYQADDHIAIEAQILFENGRSGEIKANLQIRNITPVATEALVGA